MRNDALPAVLFFMDGIGVRPALFEIGERLASGGYFVLLPDLYYRSGFTARDGANLFSDPDVRADWTKRVLPTVRSRTSCATFRLCSRTWTPSLT